MGRRTVLPIYQVLTDQDSSSDFQSILTEVEGVDRFAYDVTVDSSVIGTMFVQYCNEKNSEDYSWENLGFGEATTINGSSETVYRFEIETSFKRVRLSWVNNAGTGNINAKIYGIVRGA